MRKFTFSVFLFIFSYTALSQARIVEIKKDKWDLGNTVWKTIELEKFGYNSEGFPIFRQSTDWDEFTGEKIFFTEQHQFYNDLNDLIYTTDSVLFVSLFLDTILAYTSISEKFFIYDENQNLILDSTFIERERPTYLNQYAYDENNNLIHHQDFSYDEDGQKNLRTEFFYKYENGCRSEQIRLLHYNGNQFRWTYENDENCSVLKSTKETKFASADDFILDQRSTYEYENDLRTFYQLEKYNTIDQVWELKIKETFEFSETGKPVEFIKEDHFFQPPNQVRDVLIYDEFDNLVTYKKFNKPLPDGEESLRQEQDIVYEYDENNFILKKSITNTIWNGAQRNQNSREYRYVNFCDGLVKTESFDELSVGLIERIAYKYDQMADCQEDKDNSFLKLFPNPTNEMVYINSNLVSSTGNQIRIFSADGKFIRKVEIDYRTDEFAVNVSDLSNGIYFIEVKNDGVKLTERLIIAK